MKRKHIAIVAGIAIVAVLVVLVAVNPFDFGSSNNSTPPANNSTHEPPETGNWISPGKVIIDNYVLGVAVDYQLQVHNGNSEPAEFSVGYRHPDNVAEGYTRLSSDIQQHIWISEKRPVLDANETRLITIRLSLPSGFNVTAEKFEFWIGVIDQSQTGMIITELAQRWLITMQ